MKMNDKAVTKVHDPDDYLGGCPRCGRCDGYLYMNTREEWLTCDLHRVRWPWGANMTSGWRSLSPAELARQHAKASGYRIVEPCYPAPRTDG